MLELDSLPDVSDHVHTIDVADGGGVQSAEGSAALSDMQQSAGGGQQVHSSASTLTVSGSQGQQPQQEVMTGSVDKQQEHQAQQEQLIVSVDEASGRDLILDPAADAAAEAAADAEVKTLSYENAILRQAVERLGGKAPRTYVEERRMLDNKSGAIVEEAELAALRKELADAKSKAQSAKEALEALTAKNKKSVSSGGLSDKISHSSFDVGDVGLFMPTGRGSGGKRTYLAFHTNCPHRYLSTDCIKGSPDFVLGRIVYQEVLIAGEIGTDANPYGLHVGTQFFVLTVEVLNPAVSDS
jgi:Autophagy-related protein 11